MAIEGQVTNSCENISQSGLLCYTKKPIEEMKVLDIVLELPLEREDRVVATADNVECVGVVVRCNAVDRGGSDELYEVAIYFNEISDYNRDKLARYVEFSGQRHLPSEAVSSMYRAVTRKN